MKTLLCDLLAFKAQYPHLGLAAFWFIKASFFVLLAVALAFFSPSALARTWIWRITLVALILGMLAELTISSQSVLRIQVPVESLPVSTLTASDFMIDEDNSTTPPVQGKDVSLKQGSTSRLDSRQLLESRAASATQASPLAFCDQYALLAWLGIGGIFATLSLIRFGAGSLWLRRNALAPSRSIEDAAIGAAADLGLAKLPPIQLCQELYSPLIVGLGTARIYLPQAALAWGEEKLRCVFLHELAHWHATTTAGWR